MKIIKDILDLFKTRKPFTNQIVTHNGIKYSVKKLIELGSELPIIELQVKDMIKHLHVKCWNYKNDIDLKYSPMDVFVNPDKSKGYKFHYDKAMTSDLNAPIILSNDIGEISDGMHRLLKAFITKQKTIKAIVFEKLPHKAIIEK